MLLPCPSFVILEFALLSSSGLRRRNGCDADSFNVRIGLVPVVLVVILAGILDVGGVTNSGDSKVPSSLC